MLRPSILSLLLACLVAAETAPAPAQLDHTALAARSPLLAALRLPAGEWREQPSPAGDRKAELAKLTAAGERFLTALKTAKDGPNLPCQHATALLIANLTSTDKPERPDALEPAFSRRSVRGGALRRLGADTAATEVEKALLEACRMRVVATLSGPQGARLEERRDAFGAGGWVLSGPRLAYSIPHPDPHFMPMPDLVLVVDLPAKSDPTSDAAKAISATVFKDATALASWEAKDGKLTADLATWRSAVREPGGRGLAKGLLPPHLVLTGLDGDPLRLATTVGSIVPPRNGTPLETERFITDIAKTLPDTANLDLFGQYIFRYVFDSPDPRFPLAIGTNEFKGDIHQTAPQILGATTGGQCRGDCDDLGELYQTIAEKQGRFGHLLVLPSHTAFAAARKDGKDWVVEVMQTGPTLAFRAPDVRDALRAAHAHFDPTAPFSPDQLGLLLRFSGENTRHPFQLGWRIFSERAYAQTMIDVQRDWHFQTYARAIAKMDKLIAAGDRDPANFSELAGLYRATSQYGAAAKQYREVLTMVTDPVSIIQERLMLATMLRQDGKLDEAKAVLQEVAGSLKEAAPKLGNGILQISMRLCNAMLGVGDEAGARKLLFSTAFGPLAKLTADMAGMVSQPTFDRRAWTGDGRLAAVRSLLQMHSMTLLALLQKAGPDAAKDPTLKNARVILDIWLAALAFREAEAPEEAINIYAIAARIHALDIKPDALAKAVQAAKPATDAKHDHLVRVMGPAAKSRATDLSWIRICPGWWNTEVNRALLGGADDDEDDGLTRLDPAKADRARIAAAAKGASQARAACAALGFTSQRLDDGEHYALLTTALANADDKVLRERLKIVKRLNDKRLRDGTAMMLGRLAPLCSDAQWLTVLKAWADEVDYKPKWYSIAWQAVSAGAPKHALATARMAATRFKDDPAFTEEAAFMEKLLGDKK